MDADIIPFPTPSPAGVASTPIAATEQLSQALSALSTALAEQQQAIQRWHAALTDLAKCMRVLGGDMAVERRV